MMQIEIVQTFYGSPDDTGDPLIMFIEGDKTDVPDPFGRMVIAKGLAKPINTKLPARKEAANEAE